MKLEFWLDPVFALRVIQSNDKPVEKPERPKGPEVNPHRETPTKPARYPDKEVPTKSPDSVPPPNEAPESPSPVSS